MIPNRPPVDMHGDGEWDKFHPIALSDTPMNNSLRKTVRSSPEKSSKIVAIMLNTA